MTSDTEEYTTQMALAISEDGLIVMSARCGAVTTSLAFGPDGVQFLIDRLTSLLAQITPDLSPTMLEVVK